MVRRGFVATRVIGVGLACAAMLAAVPSAASVTTAKALKLSAGDPAQSEFGRSLSVSNGVLAVGAPSYRKRGAVYVYRPATGWGAPRVVQLPGSDPSTWRFGTFVALDGDDLAVASPGASPQRVDFYHFTDPYWAADGQAILSDSNEQIASIALRGDTLVIGLPTSRTGPTPGKVRIFKRAKPLWSLVATLTAADGTSGDGFGTSIALGDAELIVGSNGLIGKHSAMYSYRLSGGSWTPGWSSSSSLRLFATSLALDLDVLGVGSSPEGSGVIKLHDRAGANWNEQLTLSQSAATSRALFGEALAIRDNVVVVGASYHDDPAANSGAAWLYERVGPKELKEVTALNPSEGRPPSNSYFGSAVALSGEWVAVSAPGSADAVYVFPYDRGSGGTTVSGAFQRCSAPSDCGSGYCVDGFCCDRACTDKCFTCADPRAPGRCTAAAHGVDARDDCGAKTSCLSTCDGRGACTATFAGSQCAPPRCTSATSGVGPGLCAGPGLACGSQTPFECSPFACEAAFGTCRSLCRSDADCAPSLLCNSSGACAQASPSVADGGCEVLDPGRERGSLRLVIVAACALFATGRARRTRRG